MSIPAIVLGKRHPFPSVVSADFIRSFAEATSDENPAYRDATAVPPVALVSQIFEAQTAGNADIPQELWASMRGSVHGEHDLLLRRPLEPGEKLTTWVEGLGGRSAGNNTRITLRLESLDEHDAVAAEQYWTTVLIGTTVAEVVGTQPPDHTFPEEARRRLAATATIRIDKDMARRYAVVSGDWADHHFDAEAAARSGAAEPFLHGLCTMALCARAAVDTIAGGDPRRVRRVAVRFARPALLGRDLDVAFFDAGRDGYPFEGTIEGTPVVRHGLVELFPP